MSKKDPPDKPLARQRLRGVKAIVKDIHDDAERHTPKVPARAYSLAALFGFATTIVIAFIIGSLAPDAEYWPTAVILGFLITLPTAYMLGWTIFVSKHVSNNKKLHTEDIVEIKWIERAMSGAFFDVILLGGWGSFVLAILSAQLLGERIIVPLDTALLGVAIFASLSLTIRYFVIRKQEIA